MRTSVPSEELCGSRYSGSVCTYTYPSRSLRRQRLLSSCDAADIKHVVPAFQKFTVRQQSIRIKYDSAPEDDIHSCVS